VTIADLAAHPDPGPPPIRAGRLTVFPEEFVATYDGEELEITYRQFRLLALFAGHPGRLLRREVIGDRVWDGHAPGRSVDIQVSRLRKKLPPGLIRTVVRVGYRLVIPEDV
jgi:two-component system, OmpR family, response regulator VanR